MLDRSVHLQELGAAAGLQVAQVLGCMMLKPWLFASPYHYRPLQLLLSFCRGQIGRSPCFMGALESKELMLEVLRKMKAPRIEPEPAENLTWQPSQMWLDRVKEKLGVADLLQNLKHGESYVAPEPMQETQHLAALESRWLWVTITQQQMDKRLKSIFN